MSLLYTFTHPLYTALLKKNRVDRNRVAFMTVDDSANHNIRFDRSLLWVVYYKVKVRSRYFSRLIAPFCAR